MVPDTVGEGPTRGSDIEPGHEQDLLSGTGIGQGGCHAIDPLSFAPNKALAGASAEAVVANPKDRTKP